MLSKPISAEVLHQPNCWCRQGMGTGVQNARKLASDSCSDTLLVHLGALSSRIRRPQNWKQANNWRWRQKWRHPQKMKITTKSKTTKKKEDGLQKLIPSPPYMLGGAAQKHVPKRRKSPKGVRRGAIRSDHFGTTKRWNYEITLISWFEIVY